MKTIKKTIFLLFMVAAAAVVLDSCKKDDDVDCDALENQLEDAYEEYVESYFEYEFDDSDSNCEDHLDNAKKLLDLVRQAGSCEDVVETIEDDYYGGDYEDAVDDLEDEIEELEDQCG